MDELIFPLRDRHIRNGDGNGAAGGVFVAQSLDLVQHFRRNGKAMDADAAVDDLAQQFFADGIRHLQVEHVVLCLTLLEAEVLGDRLVENELANCRVDDAGLFNAIDHPLHADLDGRMDADDMVLICQHDFVH